ncbi:MAG: cupin-like domain-containing protein [Gammaproteobacteria bacterium]
MTNNPEALSDSSWRQRELPSVTEPRREFVSNYNKKSFTFNHGLTSNPLFQLASLIDYSQRLPADGGLAYWSNGIAKVDDRWDKSGGPRYSLQDSIANIADNNSLVMLKRVERDPVYGPCVRDLMDTVVGSTGPALGRDIIIGRATILIASPHRLTSYHIDSDTNFLFQVHGNKKFSVFDQTDRTLLTEQELERYYAGDLNGAKFNESRQKDAQVYDLDAGAAVHVPCMAPHWAQNTDSVSVALSINFDLHSVVRLARIYKLNHRLRNYGLSPTPPGRSRRRDQLKLAAAGGLAALRRVLHGHLRTPSASMN